MQREEISRSKGAARRPWVFTFSEMTRRHTVSAKFVTKFKEHSIIRLSGRKFSQRLETMRLCPASNAEGRGYGIRIRSGSGAQQPIYVANVHSYLTCGELMSQLTKSELTGVR